MAQNAAKSPEPIQVTRAELPLHCPRPGDPLWSAHPRVFLPLGEQERVVCPYCGAEYVLKED